MHKGRCNREKPPCKYFHPPQHLKDQLLINGRNHLALKNAIMTQIQGLSPGTPVVPGTIPVVSSSATPPALPDPSPPHPPFPFPLPFLSSTYSFFSSVSSSPPTCKILSNSLSSEKETNDVRFQ
ncbi:protein muscleblind-like [Penaeus japonicus]|uniref:protein muscleblind-like n=1 Tax=Penaeus japonicus TaxID=27405 RepID=UPI001C70D945|nr:protein muscleblind-like [Penaeus japonicus]